MTRRKFRVSDLPPEALGAARDLDQVDAIFKRVFATRQPATLREFAPKGWKRLRWAWDKFTMKARVL